MTGPQTSSLIDSIDRLIIDEIQKNGRISLTALASAIHLGISATRARLLVLEQREVISAYSASVNDADLGFILRAIVRLRVEGFQDAKVFEILERENQIVRCLRVTGESCFVLEIVAVDLIDLERITSQLARLGAVTTDLIYERILDRPVPTSRERLKPHAGD